MNQPVSVNIVSQDITSRSIIRSTVVSEHKIKELSLQMGTSAFLRVFYSIVSFPMIHHIMAGHY